MQAPAEDGRRARGGRSVRAPVDDAHGHVLHEVVDDRRDVCARVGLAEHVQHLRREGEKKRARASSVRFGFVRFVEIDPIGRLY